MKVILTAFDEKMRSTVMEFPDATADEITLAFPFPNLNISVAATGAPDRTFGRGRFRATGQYIVDGEAIAVYCLVELIGCACGQVRSLKKRVEELEAEVRVRNEEDRHRCINSLTDSDFG